jgi:hypothetical protein
VRFGLDELRASGRADIRWIVRCVHARAQNAASPAFTNLCQSRRTGGTSAAKPAAASAVAVPTLPVTVSFREPPLDLLDFRPSWPFPGEGDPLWPNEHKSIHSRSATHAGTARCAVSRDRANF